MPRRLLLALALLPACGPTPAPPVDGSSSGTHAADPTTPDLPTSTTPDPLPTTSDGPTSGPATTQSLDFLTHFDLPPESCDVWAQDCRPGQKCVPYASEAAPIWNALKCVDVTGDLAPGDPCTAPAGPLAGLDDCALGSFCWDVDADNHGTCIGQCTGTPEAPICPAFHDCIIANDEVLTLCEPWCDPLAPDCPDSRACFAVEDAFLCLVAPHLLAGINEPCEFRNDCEEGLACIETAAASSTCDANASGCCQPFCPLPDGPCPNPDQQCIPWYDPMQPIPPGYESLGFCAIPE